MMADRAFQRLGAVNWLVSTTRSGQSRAIYVVQTARRVNHGPISAGYPGNVGSKGVPFQESPLPFATAPSLGVWRRDSANKLNPTRRAARSQRRHFGQPGRFPRRQVVEALSHPLGRGHHAHGAEAASEDIHHLTPPRCRVRYISANSAMRQSCRPRPCRNRSETPKPHVRSRNSAGSRLASKLPRHPHSHRISRWARGGS
jgi:hypothetical protein